ncbi:hypothetical protein BH10PLA2_BH10PLA2_18670 [soil metagenome]
MEASYVSLPTLEKLRAYVLETLCARDNLEPNSTPFFQGLVIRGGRPCGLMLQIQGPRQLQAHAMWLGEEDRILFYDSTGARVAETRLCEAPDLACLKPKDKQSAQAA